MMDFIEIIFNLRPKGEENIVSINMHYAVPIEKKKFVFIFFNFFLYSLKRREKIWCWMGKNGGG